MFLQLPEKSDDSARKKIVKAKKQAGKSGRYATDDERRECMSGKRYGMQQIFSKWLRERPMPSCAEKPNHTR
jgi:hypothetical protein